jgi:hypothetical protein
LRAGALGALFGSFGAQALYSGVFVDEFTAYGSTSNVSPDDRRVVTTAIPGSYPYLGLSRARNSALTAIGSLRTYAPNPSWQIGELYALVAATEIMFGENMCSGVPLSVVSGFSYSYGPSLTTNQMLARALADLDTAQLYTTGGDSITALIAVLRGRALTDSGDLTAASAAVSAVPLTFRYSAQFGSVASASANTNNIFQAINQQQDVSISDHEGQNGLGFVSAGDSRLPIASVQGANGPLYANANINADTAPLVLASGIEAQLIKAEAALASGQVGPWANALNSLRAVAISPAMDSLPADSTSNATSQVQLAVMFRERAFWLFATGHRHGDLRRLVRRYQVPTDSVFPTGSYQGGPQAYGTSVVYPVAGESANPYFHGCIDTSA